LKAIFSITIFLVINQICLSQIDSTKSFNSLYIQKLLLEQHYNEIKNEFGKDYDTIKNFIETTYFDSVKHVDIP